MWTLAGQVDSLSVLPCARENCPDGDENCGCTQILASQPGGKFVSLTALAESATSTRVESEIVKDTVIKKDKGESVASDKEEVTSTQESRTFAKDSVPTRDAITSQELNNPQHGIVNMRNISVRSWAT